MLCNAAAAILHSFASLAWLLLSATCRLIDSISGLFGVIAILKRSDVLVAGFEPFGGHSMNSSGEMLTDVARAFEYGDVLISTVSLPVSEERASELLRSRISTDLPGAVLLLGQADGRRYITPEKVAINHKMYPMPDSDGRTFVDEPVVADGPDAYFSTLPLAQILEGVESEDVPVKLSLSAGAFVCNAVFYSLMHFLSTTSQSIPAGLIHLPLLWEQVSDEQVPSIPGPRLATGVTAAVRVIHEESSS